MKCDAIKELMLDVAAGAGEATPAMNEHLRACSACTTKLADMQKTMALLDEWQAPEPSAYFDTTAGGPHARGAGQAGTSSLAVMVSGAGTGGRIGSGAGDGRRRDLVHSGKESFGHSRKNATPPVPVVVQPGTAVGDLQALDKNEDLYANFDLLDDLQVQPDVDADQETP